MIRLLIFWWLSEDLTHYILTNILTFLDEKHGLIINKIDGKMCMHCLTFFLLIMIFNNTYSFNKKWFMLLSAWIPSNANFSCSEPYMHWFTSLKITIPNRSWCLVITVSLTHYCELEETFGSTCDPFRVIFLEILQTFSISIQNIFKLKNVEKFSVALKYPILFSCHGSGVYCTYTIIFEWRVKFLLLFKVENWCDQYFKLHIVWETSKSVITSFGF